MLLASSLAASRHPPLRLCGGGDLQFAACAAVASRGVYMLLFSWVAASHHPLFRLCAHGKDMQLAACAVAVSPGANTRTASRVAASRHPPSWSHAVRARAMRASSGTAPAPRRAGTASGRAGTTRGAPPPSRRCSRAGRTASPGRRTPPEGPGYHHRLSRHLGLGPTLSLGASRRGGRLPTEQRPGACPRGHWPRSASRPCEAASVL